METREIVYDMIGTPSQVVAAPNAHAGPFYGEAMGGATIVGTVRGVEMTLGAQWQSAALLWFNDVLAFDIDKLLRSRYVLGVEDLDAFTEIYFGMASALNTGDLAAPLNLDAVAAHAHFRADGTAATLYAESDDGTTDVDAVGAHLFREFWLRTHVASLLSPTTIDRFAYQSLLGMFKTWGGMAVFLVVVFGFVFGVDVGLDVGSWCWLLMLDLPSAVDSHCR